MGDNICLQQSTKSLTVLESHQTYDSFQEYIKNQDMFTKHLLSQVDFMPGGECTLCKCL